MDRINPLSRTTRWTVVTLFALTMTAVSYTHLTLPTIYSV